MSKTGTVVGAGGPGLLAQITLSSQIAFTAIPPPFPRKGWPLRHCRRQGWYRFHIIKMFQQLGGPARDNVMMPSAKPWSDYELEVFEEVRQKLAALYNNRYEEYYKMRTLERDMEYYPRGIVNKFILK
jgi:hypothetical protein